LEDIRKDFLVEVLSEGVVVFTLGSDKWGTFYEPFGGDNYLDHGQVDKEKPKSLIKKKC
jgi:hypothetical protein